MNVEHRHVEVVFVDKGEGLGIGLGGEGVVGIEEGEVGGLDVTKGIEARGVGALVGLVENVDAGIAAGVGVGDGAGGIGGAVVDDPDFKVGMGLRKQTVECTR